MIRLLKIKLTIIICSCIFLTKVLSNSINSSIEFHIKPEDCTACLGSNVNDILESLNHEYQSNIYFHTNSKFDYMKYVDFFIYKPSHIKEEIGYSSYVINNDSFRISGKMHQLSNSSRISKFVRKKLNVEKIEIESNGFVFSVVNWIKKNNIVFFSDFYKGTIFKYKDRKLEKINIEIDSLKKAFIEYENQNPVKWSDSRIDTVNHYADFIKRYNKLHRIYNIYNEEGTTFVVFSFMDRLVPYFNKKLSEKERLKVTSSGYIKDLKTGKVSKSKKGLLNAVLFSEDNSKYEIYSKGKKWYLEDLKTGEIKHSFEGFFSVIDFGNEAVLYSGDSILKYNYVSDEAFSLSFDLESKHQILGYTNSTSKNIVLLDLNEENFGIQLFDINKYYENFRVEISNKSLNNEKIVGLLNIHFDSSNYD